MRETTCSLLLKVKDDLELSPEELLEILEASEGLKRADLIEMMAKPPQNWLAFTDQKKVVQ